MQFGKKITFSGPIMVSDLSSKTMEDGRTKHTLRCVMFFENGRRDDARQSQAVSFFAGVTQDDATPPNWLKMMSREMYKNRIVDIRVDNMSCKQGKYQGKDVTYINCNMYNNDVTVYGPGAERAGAATQNTAPQQTADASLGEDPPF